MYKHSVESARSGPPQTCRASATQTAYPRSIDPCAFGRTATSGPAPLAPSSSSAQRPRVAARAARACTHSASRLQASRKPLGSGTRRPHNTGIGQTHTINTPSAHGTRADIRGGLRCPRPSMDSQNNTGHIPHHLHPVPPLLPVQLHTAATIAGQQCMAGRNERGTPVHSTHP